MKRNAVEEDFTVEEEDINRMEGNVKRIKRVSKLNNFSRFQWKLGRLNIWNWLILCAIPF